jgi:hypothetical protein
MEEPPSFHHLQRFIETLPCYDREKILAERRKEEEDKLEFASLKKETVAPGDRKDLGPAINFHTMLRRVKDVLRSGKESLVLGEGQNLMRASLVGIKETVKVNTKHDIKKAELYRMSRLVCWGSLFELIDNRDGLTQIAPPSTSDREIIERLREDGKWASLLIAIESKISRNNFWLDLNRYAAEALEQLGEDYAGAHREVTIQSLSLVLRVPGLEYLEFADGSPFADKDTLYWLRRIDNRFLGSTGAKKKIEVERKSKEVDFLTLEMYDRADELARFEGYPAAVEYLHSINTNDFSSEEKFSWNLCLCKTLIGARKDTTVLPRIEAIERQLEQHDLATWNPELALDALKVIWEGYMINVDPNIRGRAEAIMTRVSVLNSYDALCLEDRKIHLTLED